MNIEKATYTLTLTEPSLGTSPGNPDIAKEHIICKAPNAKKALEEEAALNTESALEKACTVFGLDAEGIFVWDYQMRGYFKESLTVLVEMGDIKGISKWATKRTVDRGLFVYPRKIRWLNPDLTPMKEPAGTIQRSLRATTMQGDRICLAMSEFVPAGSKLQFEVHCHVATAPKAPRIDLEIVEACLNHGQYIGFSQWRNASYGRFTWERSKNCK
jgi:hypothetical protein